MAIPPELKARRVLLALAAGGIDPASLRAGVALAADLSAELEALFVEDMDLLTLSALPFACEILPSGSERPMVAEGMASALRAQAACLREQLAQQADLARVKWSFRTLRARRVNALLELAAGQDVVVTAWHRRMSTVDAPGMTRIARPVVLAHEGPQPPESALVVARRLARNLNAELVLLGPPDAQPLAVLQEGNKVHQMARTDASMTGLLAALTALPSELLVMPASELAAHEAFEIGRLLDTVAVPVVLVR